MTARSSSAEWHPNVKGGSGIVPVGDGVFPPRISLHQRLLRSREPTTRRRPRQLARSSAARRTPQMSATRISGGRAVATLTRNGSPGALPTTVNR
jgi:hypothetical protein